MPELNLRTILLAILGVLAGVLITAAVVLLARGGGNAPIQVLLPTPEGTSGESGSGLQLLAPRDEANIKVDVRGAVRNPGVYALPPGSRLDDAIQAAGGVTDEADREAMHLSRRVRDEGYYYIAKIGETPRPPIAAAVASTSANGLGGGGSSQGGLIGGLIDLNSASAELLETLPSIGEVRAKAA